MTRGHFRISRTKDRFGRFIVPRDLRSAVTELDRMLPVLAKSRFYLEGKYLPVAEHFGIGMWIRNWWGLLDGKVDRRPFRRQNQKCLSNAMLESRLQQYFIDRGVTDPDAMSGIILAAYGKHLRGLRKIREPKITESERKRRTQISKLKAYWTHLHGMVQEQCRQHPSASYRIIYGRNCRWISYSIDKDNAALIAACFPPWRLIRAALILFGSRAKLIFDALHDSNAVPEPDAQERIQWISNKDSRRFEIWFEHDADPMDYSQWDRQHQWLVERLRSLQVTFNNCEL